MLYINTKMYSMMIKLIQKLAKIRGQQGISQATLAAKAGLSRLTVVRTENEQIDPRLSTVLVLARALGFNLMLVPKELSEPLEQFIRSGGKYLGQPQGIDAPKSIVDML